MTPARDARGRRKAEAPCEPNAPGSPLVGAVEEPGPNSEVPRRFTVSGWHGFEGAPVAAVTVSVDGRVLGRARFVEQPRDDVAIAHGDPGLAASGWVVDLDLSSRRADTAALVVTVFPSADQRPFAYEPIEVVLLAPSDPVEPETAPLEIRGRLDAPVDGSSLGIGPTVFAGWALRDGSAIRTVELDVGGVVVGRARLGIDRADVAAHDDDPHAPACGFELLVDLGEFAVSAGTATVRATAVALDGSSQAFESVVELRDAGSARTVAPAAPAPSMTRRRGAGLDLLVVTHDLGYGGAQLWLEDFLAGTDAGRAFPCTVVALRGGPLAAVLEARGVEVHVSSSLPVDDATAYEGRLAELGAWLGPRDHTAVLVNTFRAFPGADLAARLGLPVVWAIHESWPEPLIWAFDQPGVAVDPAVRGLAARALRTAGAVVFESEATRALYEQRAPGRTVVVPYGVDTAGLDARDAPGARGESRLALGIAEDRVVLLSMGTVEPRKCQTTLIEAFALVAAAHDDADLVLVGDLGTPYGAAAHALVERLGLAERVRIEPTSSDAVAWYLASDALLVASDVESLPRSVLEAMGLGVPVLATEVFGLAELLEDDVTGLLVRPNDLGALAEGLRRLLELGGDGRAQLGERGRRLVRDHHDAAGYVGEVRALLDALREDPRRAPSAILEGTREGRAQSARS